MDAHLEVLVRDAKEHKQYSEKIPSWLAGWRSPWKGKVTGGELITEGEDELYHLGIRVRERFPDLFNEEYHPDVYSIKTTQVDRSVYYFFIFSLRQWQSMTRVILLNKEESMNEVILPSAGLNTSQRTLQQMIKKTNMLAVVEEPNFARTSYIFLLLKIQRGYLIIL